ncbi:filamentous hemagglutinin N-terminal domain-containing protein [Ralstonia insidiosa]|uniref:Filamentous haemagglutinin FhaB/tRNA nuclease CdiA-like TPS domain-containing protein n=1 Tax=Ralstonia insidiosa TaxID=190721 RepID=A0A191ZTH3_9RALS|nr:filamentous hemagglutinin N-terminal domain-containing protein [Ralstonia insidiosa]ANJ71394.1 hypothetical protein A9Y76_02365 [Ralstonia insidiosa]MBY4908447.1 filamentous hemagglutinin N-terminal domain-containing protein [Ralstonia insidiosa]
MKHTSTNIRSIALAALLLAGTQAAHAVGNGTIVDGTGSISRNGNTTTVTQTSNKMIVNWDQMNVGANDTLNFNQKSATSAVLNRINSVDPTTILGSLNANGRVFIVNPNGVLIGRGANVSVGSLVASSLNISDADFKADRLRFTGGGQGDVTNDGFVLANESIALVGAKNVTNGGTLYSLNGDVTLASGGDISLTFADSGLQVGVDKAGLEALVSNRGLIRTRDGDIMLTAWARDSLTRSVINNAGTIEARKLTRFDQACVTCAPTRGNVTLASFGDGDISSISFGSMSADGNMTAVAQGDVKLSNLWVSGDLTTIGNTVDLMQNGRNYSNRVMGNVYLTARNGGSIASTQASNILAMSEKGEMRLGNVFVVGNLSAASDSVVFDNPVTTFGDVNIFGRNVSMADGWNNNPLLDARGNITIDALENVTLTGQIYGNAVHLNAMGGHLTVGRLSTYGDTYLQGAKGITLQGRAQTGNLTLETQGNVDKWVGLQVYGDLTYKLAANSQVFDGVLRDVVYGRTIGLPRR